MYKIFMNYNTNTKNTLSHKDNTYMALMLKNQLYKLL